MTNIKQLTTDELIEKLNGAADKVAAANEKIDAVTARFICLSISEFIIKVTELIKELGDRPESEAANIAINRFRVAAAQTSILSKKYAK